MLSDSATTLRATADYSAMKTGNEGVSSILAETRAEKSGERELERQPSLFRALVEVMTGIGTFALVWRLGNGAWPSTILLAALTAIFVSLIALGGADDRTVPTAS